MNGRIKFIISILILFLITTACSRFSGDRSVDKKQTTGKEIPEQKDQYRIAENYSDNKSQIIDLIIGPATFDTEYKGNSTFNARILYSDGTVLDILADVTGPYKGTKTINVPKTSQYILDVRCQGIWSVYRK
ncbi:MAG: hypothetical protein EHM58_04665 [Ignavibacteriae bacterium]|nr:MAG: hypothetical protein EHM58_04665 [Ignavibacteriota bacterium]